MLKAAMHGPCVAYDASTSDSSTLRASPSLTGEPKPPVQPSWPTHALPRHDRRQAATCTAQPLPYCWHISPLSHLPLTPPLHPPPAPRCSAHAAPWQGQACSATPTSNASSLPPSAPAISMRKSVSLARVAMMVACHGAARLTGCQAGRHGAASRAHAAASEGNQHGRQARGSQELAAQRVTAGAAVVSQAHMLGCSLCEACWVGSVPVQAAHTCEPGVAQAQPRPHQAPRSGHIRRRARPGSPALQARACARSRPCRRARCSRPPGAGRRRQTARLRQSRAPPVAMRAPWAPPGNGPPRARGRPP